jgi:ankyrin repeat protein
MRSWDSFTFEEKDEMQRKLQSVVEEGDLKRVTLNAFMDLNWVNPETGLPLLHYAVGRNRVEIVRFLLEKGAKVTPDRNGRWPSILALQCECDDAILDLIEQAESAIAEAHQSVEVQDKPRTIGTVENIHTTTFAIPAADVARSLRFISREVRERDLHAKVEIDADGLVTVTGTDLEDFAMAVALLDNYVGVNLDLSTLKVTSEVVIDAREIQRARNEIKAEEQRASGPVEKKPDTGR